jgi:hypothetical protein
MPATAALTVSASGAPSRQLQPLLLYHLRRSRRVPLLCDQCSSCSSQVSSLRSPASSLQSPVSSLQPPVFFRWVAHLVSFDQWTWDRHWFFYRSSGVRDRRNAENPSAAHAKRSKPTKSARGGGRTVADCVTLFEGSDLESAAYPGFRCAPPGATFRHPLRGFFPLVLSYVHRPPTRSAANRRSRLGVGDGLLRIASPSSRVQILNPPPTPGSAALHPGLHSVTRCAGSFPSSCRTSIDRPREAQQTDEVGAKRSKPKLLGVMGKALGLARVASPDNEHYEWDQRAVRSPASPPPTNREAPRRRGDREGLAQSIRWRRGETPS